MAAGNQNPIEEPPDIQPEANLQVKTLEQIIKETYKDYELTQKSVKECRIVLTDEINGLLKTNGIIKVGDKLSGNSRRINLPGFLKKLENIDKLLNTTLDYMGWLIINIDKLDMVEENLRENHEDNILKTSKSVTEFVERRTDKEYSALKWGIGNSLIDTSVGGGGGIVAVAGSAVAIKLGLVSITGILSAIGIAGIACSAVGIVGVGVIVGLSMGAGLGIAIWLLKAYQIGRCRRAKFEEILAMETDLNQRQVLLKLSVINDILKRAIKQTRGFIDPSYLIEQSVREDESLRTRAVHTYHKVYQETLAQEFLEQLPREQQKQIAESAAKNACKAILQTDLIYGAEDDKGFEIFLRERIQNGGHNDLSA